MSAERCKNCGDELPQRVEVVREVEKRIEVGRLLRAVEPTRGRP